MLRHFFLPHPHTHQKAHLISVQALVVYILLFVLLQSGFSLLNEAKPGVLGITSQIDEGQVIALTNEERAKAGLAPVKENSLLDAAAEAKAKDMFAENYWAHYSPSGKDPWSFILQAGYKFSFAGENLARNFYTSSDVVQAWMNSPSHRENILNPHYQDIGIAVVPGVLLGQQTTLVIQEFGRAATGLAGAAPSPPETLPQVAQPVPASQVSSEQTQLSVPEVSAPLIDPYQATRAVGLSVVGMLLILIALDMYVLKKRGVYQLSSRHLPHLGLVLLLIGALLVMNPGGVL